MRKFPRSLLPPIQHFNKIICIYACYPRKDHTTNKKRNESTTSFQWQIALPAHTHIEVFPMLITHLLNVSSTIEFKRTVDMQQKKKHASE